MNRRSERMERWIVDGSSPDQVGWDVCQRREKERRFLINYRQIGGSECLGKRSVEGSRWTGSSHQLEDGSLISPRGVDQILCFVVHLNVQCRVAGRSGYHLPAGD